jgi:FKBP-type peptidyl-prolyl cis-trans isomerase SlyD
MKIKPQCVVSLTWILKDTLGEVLDELDEPVEFLLGGRDLLASIEEGLQGFETGDSVDLHLEPEQTFGDYDEAQVFLESRALFPAEIEEGMAIEGLLMPVGTSLEIAKDRLFTVTEIYPEHIVLDGNHPLAGIAIRLKITVAGVREATQEEIEAGSLGVGFFTVNVSGSVPTDLLDQPPSTLH